MGKIIKRAFTLIELLVVIAIIGILSGLIVVSMNGITQKATIAKSQVFSNSLKNSLMMNLISEWKLDDASGTSAVDSWSGGNNGALTNFSDTTVGAGDIGTSGWMSSQKCISGTCLKFDGADDYINCGNKSNLNITNAITISAWVYPVEDKLGAIVMDQHGDGASGGVPVEFYRQVGGELRFVSYYNTISNTTTHVYGGNVPLNQWSFVAVTYDKSLSPYSSKAYINSVQIGTGTDQIGIPVLENQRTIGSYAGGGWFFNGRIDEVRIFNAAMSFSQIKEQYYAGLNSLLINGSISEEEYISRIGQVSSVDF